MKLPQAPVVINAPLQEHFGSIWHISHDSSFNLPKQFTAHHTSIQTDLKSKPAGSYAHMMVLHSGAQHFIAKDVMLALNKIVSQHISHKGPALVLSSGKSDPFSGYGKWKEFEPVEGHEQLFANKAARTHVSFANICRALMPQRVLFELGDHADNAVSTESAKRRVQVPLDEVFDDCGDDTSQLDLPDEALFTYFEMLDDPLLSFDAQPVDLNDRCFDGLSSWNFPGSSGNTCPECSPAVNVFDTLKPALCFLTANAGQDDLVEVFGGEGGVTRLAVKRKLKSGGNMDLVTGVDLSN